MIYLVEHFYSIQGEGRYTGVPSVFFRFGGCNMTCVGFGCEEVAQNGVKLQGCDTIYAVNREHYSNTWNKIQSSKELLDIIDSYDLPQKPVDIVLTGGEPLIYASDAVFIEFLELLHERGHRICFETNGSLNVDFDKYPIYKECVFALSVKLSNSKEAYKKRVDAKTISSLSTNSKEAFFKFSIDAKSITKELESEIDEIVDIAPRTQVYCMPVAYDKKELEENTPDLIEFCKTKAYTFSDRLHIRVWDSKKGI